MGGTEEVEVRAYEHRDRTVRSRAREPCQVGQVEVLGVDDGVFPRLLRRGPCRQYLYEVAAEGVEEGQVGGVEQQARVFGAEQDEAGADDVVEEPPGASACDFRLRDEPAGRSRGPVGRGCAGTQETRAEGVGQRGPVRGGLVPAAAGAHTGGEHEGVTPRRGGAVGLADDVAQRDRRLDGGPYVCAAFDGVGVEQFLVRGAVQDEVQFPRQVGRVAEARAHALPDEGRHDVRGVARDQQSSRAPLVDAAALCGVDGVPLQGGVVRGEAEQPEQLPYGRHPAEFLDRLAGHPHELPAPVPRPCGDCGPGPGGVADLEVVGRVLAFVVGHDVADEPVVREAVVGDRRLDVPADEAVGTVAADDPAGPVRVPVAVGVLRDDLHVVLVPGQFDRRPAAVHGDTGQFRTACGEGGLQSGLVHRCGLGPARRALPGHLHVNQRLSAGVLPDVLAGGFPDTFEAVGDTHGGEDSGRLAVVRDGTGHRVGLRPAFDHGDRAAVLGQQDRRQLAHRAVSDDQHIGVHHVCISLNAAAGTRNGVQDDPSSLSMSPKISSSEAVSKSNASSASSMPPAGPQEAVSASSRDSRDMSSVRSSSSGSACQAPGQRQWGRVVEDQGRRQPDTGGADEPVAELHRREGVESDVLERLVGVDGPGGTVTEHGRGLGAYQLQQRGLPLRLVQARQFLRRHPRRVRGATARALTRDARQAAQQRRYGGRFRAVRPQVELGGHQSRVPQVQRGVQQLHALS